MKTIHPQRILVFNVNWLGDVLLSTPVIRNIRRNYPGCFLACVVPARCYPILEGNPHLDEIICFDERVTHRTLWSKVLFIIELRKRRFDTVFLLHRSMSRALICFLAGISNRIGHVTNKRSVLLTRKVLPPSVSAVHRADYYLSVIEGAGLRVIDRHLEFVIKESDRVVVREYLERHGVRAGDRFVVMNPGGNWLPKRWPIQYWARLGDALSSACRVKIIINGGPQDAALIAQIRALMKTAPVVSSGELDLKQVGALAKESNAFITADTGPLHIAVAAGAKNIFAIFGPTSPVLTGPYPAGGAVVFHKDVKCVVPCFEVECPDNRCMRAVIPEEVFEQVKRVFS